MVSHAYLNDNRSYKLCSCFGIENRSSLIFVLIDVFTAIYELFRAFKLHLVVVVLIIMPVMWYLQACKRVFSGAFTLSCCCI